MEAVNATKKHLRGAPPISVSLASPVAILNAIQEISLVCSGSQSRLKTRMA